MRLAAIGIDGDRLSEGDPGMMELLERTGKKAGARDRLAHIEMVGAILPTARRMARNDPELLRLAQRVRTDSSGAMLDSYSIGLRRVAPPDQALPDDLLTEQQFADQVAAFAQAGLLFFKADDRFRDLSLGDRRALGGSGSVTRTMRIGDRLLLETPRVVIQFEPGTDGRDRDTIRKRYGLTSIKRLGFAADMEIAAVIGTPALDICNALMEEGGVTFAEPDFVEHVGKRQAGDPVLDLQWHLHDPESTNGGGIDAVGAWRHSIGEGRRIAVIDNGFDTAHPDLAFGGASGWFRATADMLDADFVSSLGGMPTRNHGTACAGMAAAVADKGSGGAGVAHGAELMAIACLSDQIGTQTTLARAIGYAVEPAFELGDNDVTPGADVVVCSLGPSSDAAWSLSEALREAIDYAVTSGREGKGAPVFWACTNGNHPISADRICSHPHVIAVGRSNDQGLDDASGFGPELAFLAPGVDVHLPAEGGVFAVTTGTSFAAPCAAAVAALMLGANDALTAAQIRTLMERSCDKVGPLPYPGGRNDRFGFGRVNADRALRAAQAAAATETV